MDCAAQSRSLSQIGTLVASSTVARILEKPQLTVPRQRFSFMHDERKCSRCGSARTQVIGQSVSPPGAFVRCQDCGHSTLAESGATSPKPTPNGLTQFTPPQPVG